MSKPRSIFPGSLVHVFNRGSKKELIFYGESDYQRFISKAFFYSNQTKDSIINYCLLPNHFHFLLKVHDQNSLSKFIHKLQVSHSRYFCNKYNLVGHVFRNRYKSVIIDSKLQLITVSRYIHRNPIEYFQSTAALNEYPWSSYTELTSNPKGLVTKRNQDIVLSNFSSLDDYRNFVISEEFSVQKSLRTGAIIN